MKNSERYYHKCAKVFMQSKRYSCHILIKLEFSVHIFEKNTQKPNLMKIHPVGVELFHADGQADMTKVIIAFRNIAKAPNSMNIENNRYDSIPLLSA